MTNSVFSKNSRYVQGGLTDTYDNRLGWWERIAFNQRTDDFRTAVRPGEEGRPWKIAHRIYNRDGLGWLVLQYNNIIDINEELIVGRQLVLPVPQRVDLSIMVRPTGGTPAEDS